MCANLLLNYKLRKLGMAPSLKASSFANVTISILDDNIVEITFLITMGNRSVYVHKTETIRIIKYQERQNIYTYRPWVGLSCHGNS